MDYYQLQNVKADTQMRDGIARAADPSEPAEDDKHTGK